MKAKKNPPTVSIAAFLDEQRRIDHLMSASAAQSEKLNKMERIIFDLNNRSEIILQENSKLVAQQADQFFPMLKALIALTEKIKP